MTVGIAAPPYHPPAERRVFCNRTLNMRSIRAIGYDMDYTLIHYNVVAWEQRAYDYLQQKLVETHGFEAVGALSFDPEMVIRGLVIDLALGNVVKCNRFGYVKAAYHGTSPLPYAEQREHYARMVVDLAEPRFVFVNTLFSLCEVCMYGQLVDLLDAGQLGAGRNYWDLHRAVKSSLDEAHMEGRLKAEIVANPDRFVELDADTPLALLDQKRAGKKLLLITNSEWPYTQAMMSYAFDRFLPEQMTWRELFDVIIVSARKPAFFTTDSPVFEVVDTERALLSPTLGAIAEGGIYLGGHASHVERLLGLSGDEILYVGDHMYGDLHVSKRLLRWRTALILRELEGELAAVEGFDETQGELSRMMQDKGALEHEACQLRLALLRHGERRGTRRADAYGPRGDEPARELRARLEKLRARIAELDVTIAPLAIASGKLYNSRWGLLMRAGNDKSNLARQVERYADIYTSRVSNFTFVSPFVYLRAPRGSLPHDGAPGYSDIDQADVDDGV
ncbi:MAG: HAD-IG family 5'-nucleotidase [Myxococcales bacterium]|nr:HAD-IG family 5'-nucleotidase [Myxococcales bacterium]